MKPLSLASLAVTLGAPAARPALSAAAQTG
jgi:hypothetical protein